MKKHISIVVLIFIFFQTTTAQRTNKESHLQDIATKNEGSNWYIFDKGITVNKDNVNTSAMKQYFGFDDDNSFELIKSETDELKITHHFFQQMYKGYPVQFADFRLHEFPDKPSEGNGNFVSSFQKEQPTIISFEQALHYAKQYFPAEMYMWEDTMEEASLNKRSQGKISTYFPKQELIWAIKGKDLLDMRVENYAFAYKINLCAKLPWFIKEVYIDAESGKLLNAFEKDYQCGTHNFTSNFNGVRSVQYSTYGVIDELVDNCGLGDVISTSDNNTSHYQKFVWETWPFNTNNNFLSGCSSMWAMRIAETYYYNTHSRNGFDNGAVNVDIRQNAIFYEDKALPLDSPYYANASFGGGLCKVGNNESGGPNGVNSIVSDDWNTLDIIAHEMTHGVTENNGSGGLTYSGESGAINESFSDIFGVNVYENFGPNSLANIWKVGYDRTNTAGTHMFIRNMANPNSMGDPDTYLQSGFWKNLITGDDNGGVHSNSGVQNYMYYLLVEGGAGTNANGFNYSIAGIGFSQARAIAYRALTAGYLTINANHQIARNAWVHAAVDLYGSCSTQAITVSKCWEAVGVNSPSINYGYLCGNLTGPLFYNNTNNYYISLGCSTTVIGNGNLVNVVGDRFVQINAGFDTQSGAFFSATTTPNICNYTIY